MIKRSADHELRTYVRMACLEIRIGQRSNLVILKTDELAS